MSRSAVAAVVIAIVSAGGVSVSAAVIEISTDVNGAGAGGGMMSSSAATGPISLSDSDAPSSASITADYLTITGSTASGAVGSMLFDPNGAFAIGSWTDSLTITSGGMAGSTGKIRVEYEVDGTFAASSSGGLVGSAGFEASFTSSAGGFSSRTGGLSSVTGLLGPGGTTDGTGTFSSDDLDFQFGTPFDLTVTLTLNAIGDLHTSGETGSASASATDVELTWLLFRVFDGFGTQVTSASVSSVSGTDYSFSSSVIPEPSGLVLLTVVSAVFLRRRTYHRSNQLHAAAE